MKKLLIGLLLVVILVLAVTPYITGIMLEDAHADLHAQYLAQEQKNPDGGLVKNLQYGLVERGYLSSTYRYTGTIDNPFESFFTLSNNATQSFDETLTLHHGPVPFSSLGDAAAPFALAWFTAGKLVMDEAGKSQDMLIQLQQTFGQNTKLMLEDYIVGDGAISKTIELLIEPMQVSEETEISGQFSIAELNVESDDSTAQIINLQLARPSTNSAVAFSMDRLQIDAQVEVKGDDTDQNDQASGSEERYPRQVVMQDVFVELQSEYLQSIGSSPVSGANESAIIKVPDFMITAAAGTLSDQFLGSSYATTDAKFELGLNRDAADRLSLNMVISSAETITDGATFAPVVMPIEIGGLSGAAADRYLSLQQAVAALPETAMQQKIELEESADAVLMQLLTADTTIGINNMLYAAKPQPAQLSLQVGLLDNFDAQQAAQMPMMAIMSVYAQGELAMPRDVLQELLYEADSLEVRAELGELSDADVVAIETSVQQKLLQMDQMVQAGFFAFDEGVYSTEIRFEGMQLTANGKPVPLGGMVGF